jgi:hypothetical protein
MLEPFPIFEKKSSTTLEKAKTSLAEGRFLTAPQTFFN